MIFNNGRTTVTYGVDSGDARVTAFMKNHPYVTFIETIYPVFPTDNFSPHELFMTQHYLNIFRILENPSLPTPMSEYIGTHEGIREVLQAPLTYRNTDGTRYMMDYEGTFLNIANGHRMTAYQPQHPKRTIYTLGACFILGVGVRNCGTLASQLQLLLNGLAPEQGFIVENYGHFLVNSDIQNEMLLLLETLTLKPGDIVIGLQGGIVIDSSKLGRRPHDYGEIFIDNGHPTELGQKLVADTVFELLKEHAFFPETLVVEQENEMPLTPPPQYDYDFGTEQLEQLETYKSMLSSHYIQRFGNPEVPPRIGSIVMNCNPFTLGHRYLTKQCASKVDLLVVFVVQEDKSVFPFEDRIRLVEKGTQDLLNVLVIPSGNFIISSLTFNNYFNKSHMQDRTVDTSKDVTLFAREIAPAMHISIRFAGSEPLDRVTRQYNETLNQLLPRYGITFEEIPRVERDGEVISASRVRDLLEKDDWAAIELLVPPTTLAYLKEKNKNP